VRAASRVGYLRVAVHLHAEANVEVPGLEALHDHVPRKDVELVLLALGDDTGDGTSVEQQQVVQRLGLLQLEGVHAAQLLVQEAGQLVRGHHIVLLKQLLTYWGELTYTGEKLAKLSASRI
jgi:hypothetical protein